MILLLLHFLRDTFDIAVPTVFNYQSTRMLCAAATGLGLSIFLGPAFIRRLYALKFGQPIRQEECPPLAELHEKKKDTPTMGGILMLFSMVVALLLWMDLKHSYTVILLLTTIVAGSLGASDDYLKIKARNSKGLRGRGKLIVQISLAGVITLYLLSPTVQQLVGLHPPMAREWLGLDSSRELASWDFIPRLYLPFIKHPLLTFGGIGVTLAIAFVVTGASNAVNLTDGLDGLAAGCLLMVAGCLAVIGFLSSNTEIARYLNILYIDGAGEVAVYL